PELTAAAWHALREGPPFFLIGDPACLPGGTPWQEIAGPAEAASVYPAALPVLPIRLATPPLPGHPSHENARAIVEAIRLGTTFAQEGKAAALVTNPISKKVLYDGAGFAFPGHTEYLAALAGAPRSVMMIAGPQLRVIPVTIHLPLAEVSPTLTEAAIIETVEIAASALVRDFGIPEPRIAVTGLNPHAGEGGGMGREAVETIAPAIASLQNRGLAVTGPHPADTLFHAAARTRYDVAVTMYHDQGLIPVKALDFDEGVNVTLGLPFIRTSPDHGTAFDIAGKGVASPTSLIAALRMAGEMAARR
ncbi:MAG: 4-hydroxythreonine-4-phosphate dehydrogenase PdxA, partial [Pseudomonadota bacterium]